VGDSSVLCQNLRQNPTPTSIVERGAHTAQYLGRKVGGLLFVFGMDGWMERWKMMFGLFGREVEGVDWDRQEGRWPEPSRPSGRLGQNLDSGLAELHCE